MTTPFRQRVTCPECGCVHTVETALERWIRGHPSLKSADGIVRFDGDILLHRYLIATDKRGARDIQALMFIEAKAFGAVLTDCQRDTLSLWSQVLRNRRKNIHRGPRGRHATDHCPLATAYSHKFGRSIRLKLFGGHLLRLSHGDPPSSEWIEWDGKRISEDQLVLLLRFELDPDSLRPIDWRRRYSAFQNPELFARAAPCPTA